jgi:hypothetical protein
MSVADSLQAELPPDLLPSPIGELEPDQIERLWSVFVAISDAWGDRHTDVKAQRSQWLEFLQLRTRQAPSYLEEYRNAVRVIDALEAAHPGQAMKTALFASGVKPEDAPTTSLAHFKRYVVDEFIRVWLATGGFRSFGGGNYNGYISGSRFAVQPPYRFLPAAAEVSASPSSPVAVAEESEGAQAGTATTPRG